MGALADLTRHTGHEIALGDFTVSVGTPYLTDKDDNALVYRDITDHTGNSRGSSLVNLCDNKELVIVNLLVHRGRDFGGNLTFKWRNEWLSVIDLCVSKQDSLDFIRDPSVSQDVLGSE
ncbi:hypothetical protein E2C01_003892 [Portunus trituberculatus]|uniref:Uncharacterized protein n=1 Tax=Portunus trituberculatus TaxID=210409 RepID=A0A5B7CQZ3_PORTR|nr:hypothetical protein [Portunus trituberculatus]